MNIISLGAGVQSTTMLLMAMHGEIEPMPDCAIFADTGWEPAHVYRHLRWLEEWSNIPIHRVSAGNLRNDMYAYLSGKRKRMANLPFHLHDGRKKGMQRRQCTAEYKIGPIRREIRRLRGYSRRPVTVWIGISLDEDIRMKDSDVKYIVNRYPLIYDAKMTRDDCVEWLADRGYCIPLKSSCIGCPFHDNAEWRAIEAVPSEWAQAVAFDQAIRYMPAMRKMAFLHAECIPLDTVDLRTEQEKGQLDLWGNECEGMCGL